MKAFIRALCGIATVVSTVILAINYGLIAIVCGVAILIASLLLVVTAFWE